MCRCKSSIGFIASRIFHSGFKTFSSLSWWRLLTPKVVNRFKSTTSSVKALFLSWLLLCYLSSVRATFTEMKEPKSILKNHSKILFKRIFNLFDWCFHTVFNPLNRKRIIYVKYDFLSNDYWRIFVIYFLLSPVRFYFWENRMNGNRIFKWFK